MWKTQIIKQRPSPGKREDELQVLKESTINMLSLAKKQKRI